LTVLEIEGLRTCYGGIVAVDEIRLQVPAWRMVALVGANGAGKTTLLNTIAGVLRLTRGEIRLDGARISGLRAHEVSRLGVIQVPEGRQILGPLSVEENLRLGHIAARHRGGDMNADLERALMLFPALQPRMKELAGRLSGGQQQMLAIGRALMSRPKLLLLDEPSLGLSPLIVAQVFKILRRLHEEGLTILLVEQNARLALATADYAYVMEHGRIVHQGPCGELREDPRIAELYLGAPAA